MDGEVVKQAVLAGLDYSYLHDDWVNPLSETLEGVTAEEAGWRPSPEGKGIWDIVLHLAVWTENIIERMKTGGHARPAEGAWPLPPGVLDEASWQADQKRLWDALASLREFIVSSPPEALLGGPYGLGDLLCRFVHNGYHIGQITKMREVTEASGV